MLFWGKTEKASSAISCDTVAYSLPFDSVLIPTRYFLLVFSVSSVWFFSASFAHPLSTIVHVAKNFTLCLLSLYTFFLSNHIYYFALSYSLIFPKWGCWPRSLTQNAGISIPFYPADYWTHQQLLNCPLCFWPFQFSIYSSHFWQWLDVTALFKSCQGFPPALKTLEPFLWYTRAFNI